MKTLEFLKENREKIYEIAKKHGVSNIRVFGSVARGEEKSGSDVDLLASIGKNTSLMVLVKLEKCLEKEIGRKTQIISDKAINKHIKNHILLEAIVI